MRSNEVRRLLLDLDTYGGIGPLGMFPLFLKTTVNAVFFLYTLELFSILENTLIGYADDSTLMAVVASPGVRAIVAESLIRDLGRISE